MNEFVVFDDRFAAVTNLSKAVAEITHPASIVKSPHQLFNTTTGPSSTFDRSRTHAEKLNRSIRHDNATWDIGELLDPDQSNTTRYQKRARRNLREMLNLIREHDMKCMTDFYRNDFPPVRYVIDREQFPEDKNLVDQIKSRMATFCQRTSINMNTSSAIEFLYEALRKKLTADVQSRLKTLKATGRTFHRISLALPDAPPKETRLSRRRRRFMRNARNKGLREFFCPNPRQEDYRIVNTKQPIPNKVENKNVLKSVEKKMFPSTDVLPNYIRKALPDKKILEKLDETDDSVSEIPEMDRHTRGFSEFSSSITNTTLSSFQGTRVRELRRLSKAYIYENQLAAAEVERKLVLLKRRPSVKGKRFDLTKKYTLKTRDSNS